MIGMREDLSDVITETFEPSKLPMSLKFVAYGRLLEVSGDPYRELLDETDVRYCRSWGDELSRTRA